MGTRVVVHDSPDPDMAALRGDERPQGAVPVYVQGPIRVQELPCEDGSLITFTVDNNGYRISDEDFRRRILTLISRDDDLWVGRTKGEVQAQTAAWWPKLTPLILRSRFGVYVATVTAATTSRISVITEEWTD